MTNFKHQLPGPMEAGFKYSLLGDPAAILNAAAKLRMNKCSKVKVNPAQDIEVHWRVELKLHSIFTCAVGWEFQICGWTRTTLILRCLWPYYSAYHHTRMAILLNLEEYISAGNSF